MGTTDQLEARLRPGAWSTGGFLGGGERLQAVIDEDAEVVAGLGLTHGRLASTLKEVLEHAVRRISAERSRLVSRWLDPCVSGRTADPARVSELVAAYEAVSKPRIGTLEVGIVRYLGSQNCPWEQCFRLNVQHAIFGASFDWTIRSLKDGTDLAGPGMIVHLIGEHRFFEGRLSPYRVDPVALARTLDLA